MLRKSTNELTIRPKMSESVKITIGVVGAILFVGVLYFAYTQGIRSGHDQYDQNQTVISGLNETTQGLRDDLLKAEQNVVFAQRQQQIQSEAYKQMSSAYSASEQKNQYLGSRLDFYRSIISPQDGQTGPAIQALDYRLEQGVIGFDVTLVQSIKHKHQVRGTLTVQLFDGEKSLGQWPKSNSRSVSYQYFQQVSGSIDAGELSQNARIMAKLALQSGDVVERWFDVKTKTSLSATKKEP